MKHVIDKEYVRSIGACVPKDIQPGDKIPGEYGEFLYWRRSWDVLSIWKPDLDGKCVCQGPYFSDED